MENLPAESYLAIPLFRDLASPPGTVIAKRIERRYRRLCFVQEELGRLNSLKKENDSSGENSLAGGVSFEDFVFSHTDFSRYKKIAEEDFDFFLEGINDFDRGFFTKNFRLETENIEALIKEAYKKNGHAYCLAKANPLILSIMRSMETSMDSLPLLRKGEIVNEFEILYDFMNGRKAGGPGVKAGEETKGAGFTGENIGPFFRFLLHRLDGLRFSHKDGNETKLFMNSEGNLCGTFRPDNRSWTVTLAKAD